MHENNKEKLSIYAGIITALITGLTGTMNLSIQNHNRLISIILYSITVVSVLIAVIVFILRKTQKKDNNSVLEEILQLQKEIDYIQFIRIKNKQFSEADNILFRMNRSILNYYMDSLQKYCEENNIELDSQPERTEPFLYFKEIQEEISNENKNILKQTIDRNNLDKLTEKEFRKYKLEKFRLFCANAETIRNAKYSNEICIVPLDYHLDFAGSKIYETSKNELFAIMDSLREITIKEYRAIEECQSKLNVLKQKVFSF
jgi:hypothetical protein